MSDDENANSKPARREGQDVVLLHSRTPDGAGVRALRARDGRVELAEVRPLQKGLPLANGEVVRLHPRKEHPFICDVETQYDGRDQPSGSLRSGPARVASARYRRNWEEVFNRGASDDEDLLN